MAIETQQPVPGGKTYRVSFRNHVNSTGVVLLLIGWVPKTNHSVPSPQSVIVAPGAEASLSGEVPDTANAHRMVIIVSLDNGERGELALRIDGALHTVQGIEETTTWEMVVV
jgi:hypothetical protein